MRAFLSKCVTYSIAIPAVLIVVLVAIIGLFAGVVLESIKLGFLIGRFVTTQAIMASNIFNAIAMYPTVRNPRVVSPDPEEEEYNGLSS